MIINNGNIQKWFFDYVEGNLTTLELKELENFVLEHPEFHEEFKSWKESNLKNEDEVPVFTPMSSLYAAIPFYETVTFRVAATVAILFSTFLGGMYIANTEKLIPEYHSNIIYDFNINKEGNVRLDLIETYTQLLSDKVSSKKEHSFAVQSKKSIVNANSSSSAVSNYVNDDLVISTSKEFSVNGSLVINEQNNTNLLVSIDDHLNLSIAESSLFITKVDRNNDELSDILSFNSNRYAFLDFKNKDGFGLTTKNKKQSKYKSDHETVDNMAAISEGTLEGDKIKKKKRKLFDNLKYIELGLGNINDPIFALSNYNTIGLNPSLSGELGITRLKTKYRNQWTSSNVATSFASMYLDTYFSKLKAGMGMGINYVNGAKGDLENIEFTYSYVQKFKLTKNANLSVGLTYSLTGINASNETVGSKYEISTGNYLNMNSLSNNSGKQISNLGWSSWYSGKFFYGGINVTNLLNNSLSGSQESSVGYVNNLDYTMQIGTDYRKNIYDNTVISPYVVMKKEGEQKEIWGGVTLRHKALVVGASVSSELSTKGIIGIQGNSFRLLYGYDIAKSDFNQKYLGSHEVSLRILFGVKTNNNWSRYGN